MNIQRPFSQACENNKQYILDKLRNVLQDGDQVLEIGSGTAQHVCCFAAALPDTVWQPAEIADNMAQLEAGLQGVDLPNLNLPPLVVDVREAFPDTSYDGIFSANCLHIMSADSVERFFMLAAHCVRPGGFLCVYGPFNYNGQFTSDSNARFEQWLKERNPLSGIRDSEWVIELAGSNGFTLQADHEMPANNRLLHWVRLA